jgi:hypothetical protein
MKGGGVNGSRIKFFSRMSQNQNPRQPLSYKVMKAVSNSRNMIPTKLRSQRKKNGINRTYN